MPEDTIETRPVDALRDALASFVTDGHARAASPVDKASILSALALDGIARNLQILNRHMAKLANPLVSVESNKIALREPADLIEPD